MGNTGNAGVRFRHITNWEKGSIVIGKTYGTNFTESNYWNYKLKADYGSVNPLSEIISLLDPVLKVLGKNIDLTPISKEVQRTRYYAETLKEYIFEDIRSREFNGKPSRRKCMFLIPHEVDIDLYGKRLGFDLSQKSIVEIEVSDPSKIHCADLQSLDCNSLSHEEKEDLARKYWVGVNTMDLNTEVLYEGEFAVTKIL